MTVFVKTEHRQSHNLPLPLSTLSRHLCVSPHSSLSPRKSISRSLHSKVHYSLLPAAPSVCYLSHSHYLGFSLWLSSLFIMLVKSDLMFFLMLPLVVQTLLLALLFLSLCRQSMQIVYMRYYFKMYCLFPFWYLQPPPSFSSFLPPLPLLPGAACTLSLLAAPKLKKKRIYANVGLKNECSPQLQCAEERREAPHYNIFLFVVDPLDNN